MPRCAVCGTEEMLAFRCTYCGKSHCSTHRLPESHLCPEIGLAAEARLTRERLGSEGVRQVRVDVRRPSVLGRSMGRLEGKLAIGAIVVSLVMYVLELMVQGSAPDQFDRIFVLDDGWPAKPWTLVTSIFSHGGFNHLFYNMLALFFFGPLLERRIGSARFATLFLLGGVLAGLAQIYVFQGIIGFSGRGVIGASGAIMAVSGALTMLAPGLRVLVFFVIPAPMWALTLFYAFVDLAFAATPDSVAHVAHLTGLAFGLTVGYVLRGRGFRFPGEMGHVFGRG